MKHLRGLKHWLMLWRWPARLDCHGSRRCCQYVDRANCNNRSASRGLHHRDGYTVIVQARRGGKMQRYRAAIAEAKRHKRSGIQ